MDKSKWPQLMKDQYNEEIRKRIRLKERRSYRENSRFKQFKVTEESVFIMLAHEISFTPSLQRLLLRFFPESDSSELCQGGNSLTRARNIFPGYYSDRERIVVMLNQYRISGDFQEFVDWLPFYEERESKKMLHLLLGIFLLDEYLLHLNNSNILELSIVHLERAQCTFQTMQANLAYSSLLAFAYYMDQNFEKSSMTLIKKAA